MKVSLLLLSILCSASALQTRESEHPIEKTINLLKTLKEKVEKEGKVEAVTFTKYEYWCTNSVKTMNSAISEGKAAIDALESKVASLQEQEQVLKEQIDELGNEILEREVANRKALSLRTNANNLFQKADADYAGTIQAIKDALAAMEGAHSATEPALVQSSAKQMSTAAKSKIVRALTLGVAGDSIEASQREQISNLLSVLTEPYTTNITRPDFKAEGDYDKHIDAYDFKSHTVIELLKDLLTKFEDEKLASVKAETNSLNAYTLEKQANDDAMFKAKASEAAKQIELGEVQGSLSIATTDLDGERSDLAEEEKTLSTTQKACALKKEDYERRQQSRADEQEAMSQAIKILAEATGVRTEAPSNPVPPPSPFDTLGAPAAFLETAKSNPKARAIQLLRDSAHATHSKALERLAQEISAHLTGPFDEVNNMIQKMIFRLNQEQKDEDDHKNWCDLELKKTDTSISDKDDKMLELKNKIDEAVARMSVLTEDIENRNEMIATTTKHMADSAEIRAAGKEENRLALKDAQDAQNAIANAIAVLEAFYKESGMIEKQPWEFIQQPQALTEPPSTWDQNYVGVKDPNEQPKGVLSVLKSVAAKFSEMEADTNANEASDQDYFEEDMKVSKVEKARYEKEVQMKTEEKGRLAEKVNSMKASRKHVSDEKAATQQYWDDLQKACVDADSTYEERVAARAKEIEALKEAQIILRDAFKEKTPEPDVSSFLQRKRA